MKQCNDTGEGIYWQREPKGQVDRLLTAIKDYRCLHAQDEGGNGLPLVDVIATGLGDGDIRRAAAEIEALHDFVTGELW